MKLIDLIKDELSVDLLDGLLLGKEITFGSQTVFDYMVKLYYNEDNVPAIYNDSKINTLFCKYIFPLYADMTLNCEPKVFIRYLSYRINTSYDEYTKLIDLYESIQGSLLDNIKNITKFNDTPQTINSGYDDSYNSTVTTSETEGASKIARLAEVERHIKDYYSEWAKYVVKGLFIYE